MQKGFRYAKQVQERSMIKPRSDLKANQTSAVLKRFPPPPPLDQLLCPPPPLLRWGLSLHDLGSWTYWEGCNGLARLFLKIPSTVLCNNPIRDHPAKTVSAVPMWHYVPPDLSTDALSDNVVSVVEDRVCSQSWKAICLSSLFCTLSADGSGYKWNATPPYVVDEPINFCLSWFGSVLTCEA